MREDSSTGTRIDKAIAAAESEFRNGLDDVQAWSQTAYPDLQPRLAAEIEKRLPVWQVLRSPPQLVQDSGDDNGVAVGAVVGGRYELTELVGHGAQASVWTAWDVEQSERVAIKVLRRLTIGDANGLRREVEALGRLKHARIAAIRDHDLGGDRPFFVREFIVGLPLNELILDDQYLDENVAAAICRDIADAISHAHEMGVIHRDLKPANVILRTADDAPVLVDFALSKIDELTTIAADGPVGTLQFMAPEQLLAGSARNDVLVDGRADVYAIGVTLYNLLTGDLPFRRRSIDAARREVLRMDPPPIREIRQDVSEELERIMLRCMEKKPQDRYQTARELSDELNRFCLGQPILYRGRTLGKKLVVQWRRNKSSVMLAVAAVLLLSTAVGLAIGGLQYGQMWAQFTGQQSEVAGLKSNLESRLLESQLDNAESLVNTGERECTDGRVELGLLYLAAALDGAAGKDAELEREIRLALGSWTVHSHELIGMWRHGGRFDDIAFAPDGRSLFTASGSIRQWSVETGQSLPAADPDKFRGNFTAISRSGRYAIAARNGDQTLQSNGEAFPHPLPKYGAVGWDLVADKPLGPIWTFPKEADGDDYASPMSVAISNDGRRALTGHLDNRIRLWDVQTGKMIGQPMDHGRWVTCVGWADKEKLIVSGGIDGWLRFWDPATQQAAAAHQLHSDSINDMSGHSRTNLIYTASSDRSAICWHVKPPRRQEVAALFHQDQVRAVAFNGLQMVATGGDDRVVNFWDDWEHRRVGPVLLHPSAIVKLAFRNDGQMVASGTDDGVVRVWRIRHREITIGDRDHNVDKAVLRDNQVVSFDRSTGSARTTYVSRSARVAAETPSPWRGEFIPSIYVNSAGTFAVLEDTDKRSALLWNVETNQVVTEMDHDGQVDAVHFGPDYVVIVVDDHAHLYDLKNGEQRFRLGDSESGMRGVVGSPDGQFLAISSLKGGLELWDARNGKSHKRLVGHRAFVTALHFDHLGRLFVGDRNGVVFRWGAADQKIAPEPLSPSHAGPITSITTSQDGLLVTGSEDGTVRTWDTVRGIPIAKSTIHGMSVEAVACSPDGSVAASADESGGIRVWQARTGRLRTVVRARDPVDRLQFSQNGRWLLATGEVHRALVIEVPPPTLGAPASVMRSIQARTGLRLGERLSPEWLDISAWQSVRDSARP